MVDAEQTPLFCRAQLRNRLKAAHGSLHQSLNAAGQARRALAAAKYQHEFAQARLNWAVWMRLRVKCALAACRGRPCCLTKSGC